MPHHERAATLLLLYGLAFVLSARLPPSHPGGATPRSLAPRDDDDDAELISRVVDARVKTLADERTVAALSDVSMSEYSNKTKPSNYTDLLAMPQQMLRRTLMHLKKQHPSLFLLVASAVVQHSRARADKSSSVKSAAACRLPRRLVLRLVAGDARIDSPHLVVPHPRMRERAFVLLPLSELSPGLVTTDELRKVQSQVVKRL